MKRLIILAAMLPLVEAGYDCAALAQVPVPEITLKVTPPELDIISEGLQTQPFGKVVPLINKLRQQVIDQQPKPPVVDKPVEAPK